MHVFLLGPPGSGKTSVSTVLKERYGVCHITANEAVAHAVEYGGTRLNESLRRLLDEGKTIPDVLLARVIAETTRGPDCINGFILDGFPKTIEQARLLEEEGVNPDGIVVLNFADRLLIDRYAGRWVHPGSGRLYHSLYNPPVVKGRDDITGEPLVQRAEDTKDAVAQRLAKFHENLSSLRLVYEDERLWHSVDGCATLDTVHLLICGVLDSIIASKHRPWWSKLFSRWS